MWKHVQPFGHRRTNSRRGKNRDLSARNRAHTIQVSPDEINPSAPTEISNASRSSRSPANPSPQRGPAVGSSTHKLMTTATVNETQASIPPTKASLKAWWNHFAFAQKTKREVEEKKGEATGRRRKRTDTH